MTIQQILNDPRVGLTIEQKQIITAWWQQGWQIFWQLEVDPDTGGQRFRFTAKPPPPPNYSVFPEIFGHDQ